MEEKALEENNNFVKVKYMGTYVAFNKEFN